MLVAGCMVAGVVVSDSLVSFRIIGPNKTSLIGSVAGGGGGGKGRRTDGEGKEEADT